MRVRPTFLSTERPKKSLDDPRHHLGNEYSPTFDYELWENTIQGGNTLGAARLQQQLLIKYADYPALKTVFANLKNRPFAVGNLGDYDPFRGLLFDI